MAQFRFQLIDADQPFGPGEKLQHFKIRVGLGLSGSLEGQFCLLFASTSRRRLPEIPDIGNPDAGKIRLPVIDPQFRQNFPDTPIGEIEMIADLHLGGGWVKEIRWASPNHMTEYEPTPFGVGS